MSLNLDLYKARLDAYKVVGKEGKINSMKKAIADDFFNNPSHFEVSINDVIRDVHLIEETQKTYKILCMPDEEINAGEYVKLNGDIFLCLYRYPDNTVQSRGIIQETNHDVKWIDIDSNLIIKPSIVDAKTLYTTGVRDDRIIEIPNGMIGIQLPFDDDTKKLNRGYHFIFNKTKYEVSFYDDTSYNGLVVLICKEVEKNSKRDDMTNGIANRYIEAADGSLVDRLDKSSLEPEPEDPNDGVRYTYTAQMKYPEDPDDEIWWNESATYIIHKFIDDVEVDAEFDFVLEQNPDNLAFIENQTTNSVTIEAFFGAIGEVILRAIDIETGKLAITHKINIIGS